jgi:hypothetical protein
MERIAEVGQRAGAEISYNTPLAISAGCALYPDDATDAESLLEKADERMYEEKRRRKSGLQQLAAAVSASAGQLIVFPKPGHKDYDAERAQAPNSGAKAQQA